jgi:hypothetical protein
MFAPLPNPTPAATVMLPAAAAAAPDFASFDRPPGGDALGCMWRGLAAAADVREMFATRVAADAAGESAVAPGRIDVRAGFEAAALAAAEDDPAVPPAVDMRAFGDERGGFAVAVANDRREVEEPAAADPIALFEAVAPRGVALLPVVFVCARAREGRPAAAPAAPAAVELPPAPLAEGARSSVGFKLCRGGLGAGSLERVGLWSGLRCGVRCGVAFADGAADVAAELAVLERPTPIGKADGLRSPVGLAAGALPIDLVGVCPMVRREEDAALVGEANGAGGEGEGDGDDATGGGELAMLLRTGMPDAGRGNLLALDGPGMRLIVVSVYLTRITADGRGGAVRRRGRRR